MGVETPKPALPTQTDSELEPSPYRSTETDIATDLSRRTDKTSYSIPEDGREVTIPVKKRREKHDRETSSRLTKGSHHSQTSLLIEYFEGGEKTDVRSRPSVRVKVTPSAARKIKNANEHIQVTESKGSRTPSYTRRISLGPHSPGEGRTVESADDKSISSYTSAAEESSVTHRYPPVEIEVLQRGEESELSTLSAPRDERYMLQNPSEISSMPPDSMLEEKTGNATPRRSHSRTTSQEAVVTTTDTLKTPSRRRSRSLSKERLVHKAAEKLAAKDRESSSGKHRRSSKTTRSRSVSSEQLETLRSSRHRSSKHHHEEELTSSVNSSVLTNSQLSPRRQSGDQYSFRSTTSKSSHNVNPRLLETVENAIRRLIMPELENLKQEQKMQKSRSKFEKDSIASGSSVSREEMSRKLSKHASAPNVKPKVVLNRDEQHSGTILSGDSIKGRKESRRSRKSDSPSEYRSERGMSEETVIRDGEKASKTKSKEGHRPRDVAAGGIVGGILTAAALNHHDSKSSGEKKERRRRRSKSHGSHSRSASIAESTEDVFRKHDVPPMPMQSDIHSSDITRDSILSERTDGTYSPSAEVRRAEIRQLSRGSPHEIYSPALRTPTKSPIGAHKGSLSHRSKYSHGDLSEEHIRGKSPGDGSHRSKAEEVTLMGAAAVAGALVGHHMSDKRETDDGHRIKNESRGLSPVQSVSSHHESEANQDDFRHKHSTDSIAALKQQHKQKQSGTSVKSMSSAASAEFIRSNRPKGINLEPGEDVLDQHHLRDSGITEGEYSDRDPGLEEWFQEEHEKNDRYRGSMGDSTVEYKHMTNYTDDSLDAPYLDRVTAVQERQEIGAGRNPDYRSTPVAVESAVASLHDPSVLSIRSKQGDKSYTESQEGEKVQDSTYLEGASRDLGIKEGEHERHVGEHTDTGSLEEDYARDQHFSSKSPRQSPAHSLEEQPENIPMGANAVPNADDPMPEIGHNLHSESDISTNPSIIQGPMGGAQSSSHDPWYQSTQPRSKGEYASGSKDSSAHASLKAAAAGFLTTAAVASAVAIRKKDPYEEQTDSKELPTQDGYQPHVEEEYEVNHDFGHMRDSYMSGQAIPSPPKDEGYISSGQRGPPTPEMAFTDARRFNDAGMGDLEDDNDPFVGGKSHARHMSTNSGLAQGVGSPLYDSATGGGLDRIQSKDIVALMDHVSSAVLNDGVALLTCLAYCSRCPTERKRY